MLLLLYAIVKFLAYSLWCLLGLHLFAARPSVVRAVKFGAVRWLLGLALGVCAAISLGSVAPQSVAKLYFGVYLPLRVVEWSIMVSLLSRGVPGQSALVRSPRAWLWVLGGIAVSFASDLASPEGMEGRFCVGRCLCQFSRRCRGLPNRHIEELASPSRSILRMVGTGRGWVQDRNRSASAVAEAEGAIQFSSPRILARALVLFWALWFSVVWSSNAGDALREAGLLAPSWRFASGNFSLLAESVSLYSLSRTTAVALFSLVLVVQLAAALLFWRATWEPDPLSGPARSRILLPFFVGIALFGGFLVCDEILLVYRRFPNLETTHFVILCALLLSLVLVHSLEGLR